MLRIASLLLVLPFQEAARTKPEPPPVGSGVHVSSTLESSLSVRFTADGKELRRFERSVKEQTDAKIEVVAALADGLTEEEAVGLESPTAPPPYVRVRFGSCPVKVWGPEGAAEADKRFDNESDLAFFIERAAAEPKVRTLYRGYRPTLDMLARVLADADALVVGPRLAPLVIGRELKPGAILDVEPAVIAPIATQAVTEGTVTRAQLTFKGDAKDGATDLLEFGITLVVEWKGSDELPVTATFELAGTLKLVKRTAQPFALELSGPIRYGGSGDENGAKLEIAGTGSLTFTYRAEPLASK